MLDLYCTIFVLADTTRPSLAELLAAQLGGTYEGQIVSTESVTLEVLENEDWDPSKYEDSEKAFLYYPFCLDVEPTGAVDETVYIGEVAKLLTVIRSHGYKAVAACDFEDQLPPG